MEPTGPCAVHVGLLNKQEIMMMQQPAPAAPSKPIPQHVLERMESEWKQMRESADPKPVSPR
jgi:hypothetical protein